MLIKHKLLLNTSLFLVSLMLMFFAFNSAERTLVALNDAKTLVYEQTTHMLSLRRHEKDFLARLDISYQEKYNQTFQILEANQVTLERMMQAQGLPTDALSNLNTSFKNYQESFEQVVAAHIELGLTPKTGLTGQLRSAVHGIEDELKAQNQDALLVLMLQLRRAEKDFMLRSQVKYITRFEGLIDELRLAIKAANFSPTLATQLQGLTDDYETGFINYANGAKRIGLNSKEGLMLAMRKEIQATEGELALLVETLKDEINHRIEIGFYTTAIIFALIAIICGGLTLLINRSILSPLHAIQKTMQHMHETQNITQRLSSPNKDEIRWVANSVNVLLDDMQAALETVWQAADEVTATSSELSKTANKTNENIQKQRDETKMVAASMEEMVSTVAAITQSMGHVSEMSKETQGEARSGKGRVDSAITGIVRLSDRLDGAVGSVDELATESERIGSMLSVIQGIAEQTNLLALNAAIEAARAGEQGRGFAVVADEVRALASRTHEATIEISTIIETLQQRTKGIVQLVGDCREDGNASRNDAEQIKRVLDGIIQSVFEIAERSTAISQSLEVQATATTDVGECIDRIRMIAEETSNAMEKSTGLSNKIASQSDRLHSALAASKE